MKHMPRLAIHMEKSVNSLDELISWVDGVSGDFQGGANSVSQVYGVSDMALACLACRGRI